MSKSAVGIYSNAISIVESIWLISRSISMVQNARIVNSNDLNYSVRITVQLLKVSFLLVFGVVIILQFIPASFYQFLFGEEFGDVRTVILTVSPGILFFCISFILSGLFAGTGNYKYNTISSLAGLIVTIPLVIILIPKYGLIGAGISASVSYCTHTAVKLTYFIRKFPVEPGLLWITKTDFKQFFSYLKTKK
jgi:O-antigen/teichoic acid export membrane protein